ncbi:hypothetical protein B0H19DRAFT_1105241 [Mycena capillaripes]|nr:hypothetical protein B0H19DRAFT_1105241 [Mycena capillaripes]
MRQSTADRETPAFGLSISPRSTSTAQISTRLRGIHPRALAFDGVDPAPSRRRGGRASDVRTRNTSQQCETVN